MARSYALKDWNDHDRSFRVVASTPLPIKCSEWDPNAGDKDAEGRPMGAMVEYWEALEGWDFRRFAKNPLVFESHETGNSDHAIGQGSEYKQTEDGGLEMKVTLAPANVNKRTLELEPRIKEGYLRGVSVGWEYGDRSDELRNGRMTRVYRNNKLTEVSLCPIPADEDGLVEADETDPEAQRRERISNAGRLLSQAKTRTDAADIEVRTDFIGSVGKFSRTQVGGVCVPARLTRTGILEYRRPDGTVRRELRLASEVFNTDSLSTLHGATVTDLSHHRDLLTTASWNDATRGHTDAVRKDGNFVSADLMINDPTMVADIENGRLHDISCGYSCKLDHTSGVFEGQPYDAIQRNIRYNHVAVLPKGKGRAGTDVALRLDARDAECVELKEGKPMTARVIRIDGKNLDFGSEEHINHIENGFAATLAPLKTQVGELSTRCDSLAGELEVARTDAKKAMADLKEEQCGEKAKEARKRRRKLMREAVRLMADEDDEDEKYDALDDLSDRDVMLQAIRCDARFTDGNASDGTPLEKKADAYIEAIFHSVSQSFTRADGIDSVVGAIETVKRVDAKAPSVDAEFQASRAKANSAIANAWRDQPAK